MGPAPIIGRDAELERIAAFVCSLGDGPGVLVVDGEPGAGKTTLMQEALARGPSDQTAVLSCHPVESEATLSFSGLGDLLAGVIGALLDGLPVPQRRALEAALLLAEAPQDSLDHRAVGAATLSALRALSSDRPVLIAIDDLQWLDRPSSRTLAFAFRRLSDEPIGLLASMRTDSRQGEPFELMGALRDRAVAHLQVKPLSVGAVERLLDDRLALRLPRTALLHLHETARGNPFFALELGRALVDAGSLPGPGQPLPVPDDLHRLLIARVGRLPADARRALLLASLLSPPAEDSLARAFGAGWDRAVERGRRAAIIEVTAGMVRFAHPLLASAVAGSASSRERRDAHRRLAHTVDDQEERARHLALATTGPEEEVAAALEQASEHATRRGAPDAAAELAELARALTPEGRPHDVSRRLTNAGEARFAAGDSERAAVLFTDAAEVAAPGPERAKVLWHLANVRYQLDDVAGSVALLEGALREPGLDVGLRATIEHDLAHPSFLLADMRASLRHSRAAAELAEQAGNVQLLSVALCQLAGAEFLSGLPMRWELMTRGRELEDWDHPSPLLLSPSMPAAHVLWWLDRLDDARARLEEMERELLQRGEEGALPFVWYRLAELDCWAGEWQRGREQALAANRLAVQTGQNGVRPATCYAVALLAAHLGQVEEARIHAEEGLSAATSTGAAVGIGINLAVQGFLELSLGHPDQAHALFRPVVRGARAGGMEDPAPLWWLSDDIEALVAIGAHEEAEALTEWLESRGRAVDRPRGLAGAARSRALLAAARGRTEEALAACDEAFLHHDRVTIPFERGRTHFVKGRIARRARKWGVARASLEDALAVFEGLGAALWTDRARDELARIGGRRPSRLDLSDGERRIAALVAAGRSNREVAEALFLSPRTVSASLARVYRKLGVTSRTEMAARLHREPSAD